MWFECVQIHGHVVYTQWVVLRWRQNLIVMMISLSVYMMTSQLLVRYVCLCFDVSLFMTGEVCSVFVSCLCNESYYYFSTLFLSVWSTLLKLLGIYCIINTVSQSVSDYLSLLCTSWRCLLEMYLIQYQHWLTELLHAVLFTHWHCVSELSVELSLDTSDLYLFVTSHCLYDIMSALNVYKYALHM